MLERVQTRLPGQAVAASASTQAHHQQVASVLKRPARCDASASTDIASSSHGVAGTPVDVADGASDRMTSDEEALIPIDAQRGSQCLMHALSNLLRGVHCERLPTLHELRECSRRLDRGEAGVAFVDRGEAHGFADGNWVIEVADEWCTQHLPCCRLQHSGGVSEIGDGENILGVIVQPGEGGHFICYRWGLRPGAWEAVDSQGERRCLVDNTVALAPTPGHYFFLHTAHCCDVIPPLCILCRRKFMPGVRLCEHIGLRCLSKRQRQT